MVGNRGPPTLLSLPAAHAQIWEAEAAIHPNLAEPPAAESEFSSPPRSTDVSSALHTKLKPRAVGLPDQQHTDCSTDPWQGKGRRAHCTAISRLLVLNATMDVYIIHYLTVNVVFTRLIDMKIYAIFMILASHEDVM